MGKIIASCAVAVLMLGALSLEASAQSSCGGWYSTCKSRCKSGKIAGCDDYCAGQMSSCKSSGCWKEGANFGGAKHCGLKK